MQGNPVKRQESGSSLMAVLILISTMVLIMGAVFMATTGEARLMKRSVDRDIAIAYGDGVIESLFDQWRTAASSGQNLTSVQRSQGLTGAELLASPFSLSAPGNTALPVPQGITLTSWSVNAATPYRTVLSSTSRPTVENGTNSSVLINMYYIASATVSFPHGQVVVKRVFTRSGKNIFNNFLFSAQPVTEIDPGQVMNVNGSVYVGGNLYTDSSNLNLQQDVSYTGNWNVGLAPGDTHGTSGGAPTTPASDPPHLGAQQKLVDVLTSQLDANFTGNGNYYDPVVSGTDANYANYQDQNNKGYHELLEDQKTPVSSNPDPLQIDTTGGNERLPVNADYRIYVDVNNNVTIYKGTSTTAMTAASNASEYNAIMGALTTNTALYDGRVGDTVRVVNVDVGKITTAYNTAKILDNNTTNGVKANDGLLLYIDDTSAVKATITSSSVTVSGTSVSTNGYDYNIVTTGTNGLHTTTKTSGNITSSFARGIRLVNGGTLPSGGGSNLTGGLSIVTPNPAYIQGDFNTGSTISTYSSSGVTVSNQPASNGSGAYPTTTSTPVETSGTYTKQTSVVAADAVTILSNSWSDANSNNTMSSGSPSSTTINTAIVAGDVPTAFVSAYASSFPSVSSIYSGGVENFPRLLENWSNQNLTIHGSFALLYNSEQAIQPWQPTGNYYNAPQRHWFFDTILQNTNPPGFPAAFSYDRGIWLTQ